MLTINIPLLKLIDIEHYNQLYYYFSLKSATLAIAYKIAVWQYIPSGFSEMISITRIKPAGVTEANHVVFYINAIKCQSLFKILIAN